MTVKRHNKKAGKNGINLHSLFNGRGEKKQLFTFQLT